MQITVLIDLPTAHEHQRTPSPKCQSRSTPLLLVVSFWLDLERGPVHHLKATLEEECPKHCCPCDLNIMRAVLQRVISAHVEVEGRIVSRIGPGLLVLVGVLDSDTDVDAEYICRKVLNTRIFSNDKTGKPWDQSVMQKNYEVLLVSQFTLYGMLKGNKLDFHIAMSPDRAKPFYESFVGRVAQAYRTDAVKDGVFGAMMQVHLVNDGPVTIQLDSRKATAMELEQSSNHRRSKVAASPRCKVELRNFQDSKSFSILTSVPMRKTYAGTAVRLTGAVAGTRSDFWRLCRGTLCMLS